MTSEEPNSSFVRKRAFVTIVFFFLQFITSYIWISYLHPRNAESRPSTESRRLVKFSDAIIVIPGLCKRKKLRDRIRLKEEKKPCVVRYSCHVTQNDCIQVSCCQRHLIALSGQLNQNDLHPFSTKPILPRSLYKQIPNPQK